MAVWDITSYAYSGRSFSLSTETTAPEDISFKDDGTKMFVLDNRFDKILEYALSTAWDVSTATFTDSFSILSQEAAGQGLAIGNNGLKLYVVGVQFDSVNEYDLSTAWDISTGSYLQNFSVSAQEAAPTSVNFNDAGTKMFVIGFVGDDINEYALSTAWDVSTATFTDSFSISSQTEQPESMAFGDSGSKVYVADTTDVYEYSLSTAYDISTASFVDSLNVSAQDTSVQGVFFRPNGNSFYVSGSSNDAIFEYIQPTIISAISTIAGTSTFTAFPTIAETEAIISGASAFAAVGDSIQAAGGRAVDEASAGGTNVALSVSINSAITEPANPSGNT
tara:strand:- start:620 stop:1624 length:1005 start_codon:yes stop_codon:yes gene_type:complete